MKAKIENGKLVIVIELEDEPRLSSSGKTLIVATTGGFKTTGVKHPETGKEISLSINATIKN